MEFATGALAWPGLCEELILLVAEAVRVEASVDCCGVPPNDLPAAVESDDDETKNGDVLLSTIPMGGEGNSEWAINLVGDRGSDRLAVVGGNGLAA